MSCLRKVIHAENLNFQRFPGKDKIPLAELKSLLGDVGLDLPNFKIREILNKIRQDTKDEFVTKAQFLKVRVNVNQIDNPEYFSQLYESLTADDVGKTFRTSKRVEDDVRMRKCSRTGDRRSVHIVSLEEQAAFADWITTNLAGDKRMAGRLDIEKSGANLYEKMDDGIILCKMVNIAAPGTIKVRFEML